MSSDNAYLPILETLLGLTPAHHLNIMINLSVTRLVNVNACSHNRTTTAPAAAGVTSGVCTPASAKEEPQRWRWIIQQHLHRQVTQLAAATHAQAPLQLLLVCKSPAQSGGGRTAVFGAVEMVGEVVWAGNATHNGSTGHNLLLHGQLPGLQLAVCHQLHAAQHSRA
jgi:hypothetical protein